jgi:hypothetical protein
MRVKLNNAKAYDRAGTGDHSLFSNEHCCICGKKIEEPEFWLLLTRAVDGTQEFAISNPSEATKEERRDCLWLAPIGSDCLKRNPHLEDLLIRWPFTAMPHPHPIEIQCPACLYTPCRCTEINCIEGSRGPARANAGKHFVR